MLLRESVMIRRLKADVMMQLPAKRRQLVPIMVMWGGGGGGIKQGDDDFKSRYKAAGMAKVEEGTRWLKVFVSNLGTGSGKTIVFAHHRAVMDSCACTLAQSGIGFVRLDGSTPMRMRLSLIASLRTDPLMRVGLVSGATAL